MAKTNNIVLATLFIVLGLLAGGLVGSLAFSKTVIVEKDNTNVSVPAVYNDSELVAKIDALSNKVLTLDEFESEVDEKLQNDTAKELVLSEVATKDFKKAILAVLEDNSIANKSIESYADLTIYLVEIEDVDLGDDDTAEVEVLFKVSGFEDSDEESDFKARFTATFLVEDLDVDDMSDAEVSEYEIILEKFYD